MHLDPTFVFFSLIPNQAAFDAIIADRNLTIEAFADKHHDTLREHFARTGKGKDVEHAYQAATQLHGYLQSLLERTDALIEKAAAA